MTMTDPREIHVAAEAYLARGWPIIAIPPINGAPTKRPSEKGWPNHLLQEADLTDLPPLSNLGLLLRDLTDADMDSMEAIAAGKIFLPPTGLIYGHSPSAPTSHYLYETTDKRPKKTFKLPGDEERGALCEYRSMASGTSFQSVLPPSTHPSGEKYAWERYAEPSKLPSVTVWRAVHLVAITAALARLHPPLGDAHKTQRDEYRLAISGMLARQLPESDALAVFTHTLRIAGDSKDRRTIFEATVKKVRAGDSHVPGIPTFIDRIGRERADAILGWISEIAVKPASARPSPFNGTAARVSEVEFEDEEEHSSDSIPLCPSESIDGDLLGEMTRALTDGTAIPAIFVRENLKTGFGAILNGKVGLRSHPHIHTREYHLMVSRYPEGCKDESWQRTWGARRGFLNDFLGDAGELTAGLMLGHGIAVHDSGLFGSGEIMTSILSKEENKRSIMYADEMSEVFTKDRGQGSIIETKLLELFEGDRIASGSFKNKIHIATGLEFSTVGGFTKSSFDASFAGRGSRGSGYLSRCIHSYADRVSHAGDWQEIDTSYIQDLRAKISSCLATINAARTRDREPHIIEETPEASALRQEVAMWIEGLDDSYKPRLASHMKRDLILRAVFASEPVIDLDKVQRSKLWVEHQYETRRLLWPEDAGSNVERMEAIILRALEKSTKPLSDRRLSDFCNARRPGNGGFSAMNFAILALVRAGQIKRVGKTRKGHAVYEYVRLT